MRLDHLLSMETMLCERHGVIFGRAHSSWLLFGSEGSKRDFQKITFLVPVRCEEGQASEGRSYWRISTGRDEALTKQMAAIKMLADLEN